MYQYFRFEKFEWYNCKTSDNQLACSASDDYIFCVNLNWVHFRRIVVDFNVKLIIIFKDEAYFKMGKI